ncbi:MAG: cytidylate kinase-like family protein [Kofleriaceae bacterium]|nr:cytidylate kinase-like family protein [Kofleriaceae bacterium]MCL4224474.1 cytidylate kinase family protein [Myxococcales bacterium]
MERAPRSVDAIVEAQVQRWLEERRRATAPPPVPPPVITVSREYGAQGAVVARRVAERLGYAYWNRDLLAAIASHARVDPATLAQFDEHHRSPLVGIMSGIIPQPTGASQLDYARELTQVVRDLAARGAAVVVGRGLNFMLDPDRTLRVRVVCPLEQRVRELAAREGLSAAEARALIVDADRDRRAFVHDLFGKDVEEPTAYDLWLNTGTLSLDAAAEIVVAACHARFGDQARRPHAT